MLNKYPALGAALCDCGNIPIYGRNCFHVYKDKKEYTTAYYCAKCEKTVGVIGPRDFALYHWNLQTDPEKQILNAPEGFRFGKLRIETRWMGGSSENEFNAVLFKNDELKDSGYVIFDNIKTVEIINPINGKSCSINFRKRCVGYVYLTQGMWFNPTRKYNCLQITAQPSGFSEIKKLEEIGYPVN